jgi:hypothetical protein
MKSHLERTSLCTSETYGVSVGHLYATCSDKSIVWSQTLKQPMPSWSTMLNDPDKFYSLEPSLVPLCLSNPMDIDHMTLLRLTMVFIVAQAHKTAPPFCFLDQTGMSFMSLVKFDL